jgi:thiol:disulfide interchange protein
VTLPTAPVAAGSLVAGYLVARETRVRSLGGFVLGAASVYLARRWRKEAGATVAGALLATYLAGFGVSHPLAKRIGAWPAVLSVAAVSAVASNLLADRRRGRR